MFEALIQKLEAAVEWDEQLDREIEEAVDSEGRRLGWGPYPYTSKIDAARGLLDRVLPGWAYRVARCAVSDDAWVIPDFNCPVHGERLRAELRQDIDWSDLTDVDLRPSGREATALCISILKALEIINAQSHQAAGGEHTQQEDETLVVDLTSMLDNRAIWPAPSDSAALDAERNIIALEARRYASFYPEASDGRNTFVGFAEWVELRQERPKEVFTVGDNTMEQVFRPAGLTNLHDLQAVLDAVEKALSDDEPVAAMTTDYLGCEYVSMDVAGIEKIAASGSKGPTEVVYLYDRPQQPAPTEAVKALATELEQLLDLLKDMPAADRGYSWELRNSRGHEEIRAYGENAKTFKFVIDNRDALISALSAQVQDVADMPQSPWPASDWAIGRIKELEAQAVPEGWQLVPEEPTPEMLARGAESSCSLTEYGAHGVYVSMLAAAPASRDGA